MNDWWTGFILGFVPTAAAATIGWLRWLHELREKRREKDGRAKSEAELKEIRRRGLGPYLRAAYLAVPPFTGHGNQIIQSGDDIDPATPAGTRLALMVANVGAPVRELTDDWPNGTGIDTTHDLPHDEHTASMISYLYDPMKLGQTLRIRLDFETLDGVKLHHVYETRHGYAELKRVDPD